MIFSSLRDLLAEQWTRLSALEQALLTWLAIVREPLEAVELHELLLVAPVAEGQVREALEALHRRSLVEQGKQPATFTLQSVVLEYVTEVLVERVSEQIQQGVWEDLISYALEQAGAKEYVRQTQERLIVAPILVRLQTLFQQADALEEQLLGLLDQLRTWDQETQGYGPANLIALLRLLRGHLRGLDLSQLATSGCLPARRRDARCQAVLGPRCMTPLFTEAMPCDLGSGHQQHGHSTGPQAAGEEKCACGAREASACTWSGRRTPTIPLRSPLARMNARWPAGVGMARSSSGICKVAPCSGRVGIPTSSSVWPSLLMGRRSPVVGMMPPSSSGMSPPASRFRRCRSG